MSELNITPIKPYVIVELIEKNKTILLVNEKDTPGRNDIKIIKTYKDCEYKSGQMVIVRYETNLQSHEINKEKFLFLNEENIIAYY